MKWSIEDHTGKKGGYLRLMVDGKPAHIDAFPFAMRADEKEVRDRLQYVVDCLNGYRQVTIAGEQFRQGK